MLSASQVLALAKAHCKQFESKVKAGLSGNPHVNTEECIRYLALWERIQLKAQSAPCPQALLDMLTSAEAGEIADAVADGSYDALLAAAGGS
jgi:hypothetical protein